MNILHHKSWHVRNKDNIQRVKRDEAKAAEEEKQRLKRQSLAESEARLNILRGRTSINFETAKEIQEKKPDAEPGFINLFESAEQGRQSDIKNKEAELEKAQEKEKFEKKIGLLKYLVDDELDMKSQPWYKKSRVDTYKESDTNFEVDLKRKLKDDPMNDVTSYLKEKNNMKKKKSHKLSHEYEKDCKYAEHRKSKHKKADRKEAEREPEVKKKKTIEELRAERLKREADARVKTNRLLYGIKDEEETKEPKIEVDDRKRRYNNQFNPEMSRF